MNPVIRKAITEDIDAIYRIELEGQARWAENQLADELELRFSNFPVMERTAKSSVRRCLERGDEIQLNNIGIKREDRPGAGTVMLDHIISSPARSRPKKFISRLASITAGPVFYRKNALLKRAPQKLLRQHRRHPYGTGAPRVNILSIQFVKSCASASQFRAINTRKSLFRTIECRKSSLINMLMKKRTW